MVDGVHVQESPPRSPERSAPGPIPAGPATRERAARVLEQALGAVWEGMLECRGHAASPGWKVVVGELWVVPARATEEEG